MRKYLSLIAVLTVLACVLPAGAYTIEKLPLEQQASLGANWSITFTHADLTTTATNTAQSFTNQFKVLEKQSVRFIGMQLNTAFDGTNSLYTNSIAVIVGDGDDDDIYLASTELRGDGTEVWRKFSPGNAGTIAVTPKTASAMASITTNNGTFGTTLTLQRSALADSNGTYAVTNVTLATDTAYTNITVTLLTVATNATAAFTAGVLGEKVYTADDYIDFKFTPSGSPEAGEALAETSSGSVTFYFDIQASK